MLSLIRMLLVVAMMGPAPQQRRPLTEAQVRQLIQVKMPDKAMAEEVRQRGIAFPLTPGGLDALQRLGAGRLTIEALYAILPKTTLTIRSTPGECKVLLDDSPVGFTDVTGSLTLNDVATGVHSIRLVKPKYKDFQGSSVIVAHTGNQISAILEPMTGSLTVTSNVRGSVIDIQGVGRFQDSASVECPAGEVKVSVSRPDYQPVTQWVLVKPGERASMSVRLRPDPSLIGSLANQVNGALANRVYTSGRQAATRLLSLEPDNAAALTVMAMSYFSEDNFAEFSTYASRALAAGTSLEFPVLHHHSLTGLDQAILSISRREIGFLPGRGCPNKPVAGAPGDVVTSSVTRDGPGGMYPGEGVYLVLEIRDPAKPKRRIKFSLADRSSRLQKTTQAIQKGRLLSRPRAFDALTAIQSAIDQARAVGGAPEQYESGSARDVALKGIDAVGGQNFLDNIRTLVARGTYVSHTRSTRAPFSLYWASPNKFRIDIDYPSGTESQGYDGQSAWYVSAQSGRARLPDWVVRQMRISSKLMGPRLFSALLDSSASLRRFRSPTATGKTLEMVAVSDAEGDEYEIGFDPDTFLVVRSAFRLVSSRGTLSFESIESDFTESNGFKYARRSEQYMNGRLIGEQTVSEVRVNPYVSDSLFVCPR